MTGGTSVFQLTLIRQITFWSLFIVSAFLSVNLYIGLANGIYNQGIMIFVAVALEGLKILCLTMANTNRWQATQHKITYIKESVAGYLSRSKRKIVKDPAMLRAAVEISKKNRAAIALYVAYVLTAFLSISASFGYVLETVDRATTHAMVTTNADTISIYQDTMVQYSNQMKENQAVIAQTQDSIKQYNKLIAALNPESETFQKDRAVYQGNINNYQKIIDQYQQKNSNIQDQRIALNEKIQNYKVADVTTVKEARKTMYQLMGEVLSIPDKSIMFILLYMLAILIEVGIFITSPHFHKMDEEDKEPGKADFTPMKKAREVPVNLPSTENPISAPVIPPEATVPSVVTPWKGVRSEVIGDGKGDHTLITIPIPEDTPIPQEEIPVVPEMYIDASEVTEPEPEVVIRSAKSLNEKFVEALFDNGEKPYLKDKYIAASEIGMKKIEAMSLFEYLAKTKKNGYPMIEFRKDTGYWHPNVTSEVIRHHLHDNYPVGKEKI